jgi:UDP-N-acetylglucosamine 2-epimerase (non-hydrolysing)
MKRFKIACILGTRPETIKMAPVILALQAMPDFFDVEVICTGQHRELLTPIIEWFGLDITHSMDLMQANQGLHELSGRMLLAFSEIFKAKKYSCVIGQGDTTTVLISALAAFHEKIPFAHVEAGLRTLDRYCPFPEEMNRVLASRLANIHFAPTESAAQNLRNEGISPNEVFMTGNTVIDALNFTVERLEQGKPSTPTTKKMVFVTAHRRENFGEPLKRICRAILRVATEQQDICFVFSVHPNPNVREVVYSLLQDTQNIKLVDPMPYPELVEYLQSCDLVLTDSGGLQEEAPMLKKPVLVLREETERPELVELGGSHLVGTDENNIVHWVTTLLSNNASYQKMVLGYSPYGDGKASLKIADYLLSMLLEINH